MNTRKKLFAFSAAALLALAACGSDDEAPAAESADCTGAAGGRGTRRFDSAPRCRIDGARHDGRRRPGRQRDQHRRLRRARGGQQGDRRASGPRPPEGKDVEFKTSYGASGDQSRAVVDGLEADYVHFSVAQRRHPPRRRRPRRRDWDAGPNKGIVSSSIVVFAVRAGNPKNIQTWDDLIKPGVEIVTPNPASSGAARWNALAA